MEAVFKSNSKQDRDGVWRMSCPLQETWRSSSKVTVRRLVIVSSESFINPTSLKQRVCVWRAVSMILCAIVAVIPVTSPRSLAFVYPGYQISV